MAGPPPELEPLLRHRFGTGEWRVEGWSGEVARYHPDRRAPLRLTVSAREDQAGQQAQQRFFAKVYRDEREAEHAYQVARSLWDRAGAGDAGFTVARPIAYVCRLRAVFQAEVTGPSLEDVILREENPIPQVRQAARALVVLHLSDVPAPKRRSWADQLARLEDVRNLLRSARPHVRRDIDEIVGAVVGDLKDVPLVPTHGSSKPSIFYSTATASPFWTSISSFRPTRCWTWPRFWSTSVCRVRLSVVRMIGIVPL